MTEYFFAYHGGTMPENPKEQEQVMAQWNDWMSGLGSALVNPGAPVGQSHTVSSTGTTAEGGANPLSGYSVVKAESLQSALEMARGCPIINAGGSIEVAEVVQM